ncbi:MAG: hypothetical protein ACMUHB_01100, partial [Thermoplasmatota archaeon]
SIGVHHDMVYEFRVRAVDRSGNEEEWSPSAQTRTAVLTVPNVIYKAVMIGHYFKDETEERIKDRVPGDTHPVSRVLPLSPIAIPEPILTMDHKPRILLYPDIDITNPSFAPEDGIFAYWTYGSMELQWEGIDLKGSEDLTFDIQYRRVYLETDIVMIPEARMDPRALPASTGWTDWLTGVTSNEGNFEIRGPGLYEFRCRATDSYGNVEEYPLAADACTYVLPMF